MELFSTRPGGIAYVASNIYYSSWFTLFACVYTLNLWSEEKDILSISELVGLSATLRSWWVHFISAWVVFASSLHLHIMLSFTDDIQDTIFGIMIGFCSIAISLFYILVHYDFFSKCEFEEGGWGEYQTFLLSSLPNIFSPHTIYLIPPLLSAELFTTIFLICIWIIGLSILTQQGGIAATTDGNVCYDADTDENCTIVVWVEDTSGAVTRLEVDCLDLPRQIPGSNLYFACWICMLSALNVGFRWKAAQAMKFAQAKEEQEQRQIEDVGSEDGEDYDKYD